jgi:hypothetical protein
MVDLTSDNSTLQLSTVSQTFYGTFIVPNHKLVLFPFRVNIQRRWEKGPYRIPAGGHGGDPAGTAAGKGASFLLFSFYDFQRKVNFLATGKIFGQIFFQLNR